MKIFINVLAFILFCHTTFAQQELTINFTRPGRLSGSATKITVFLNNGEIGILKNNSSFTYKGPLPSDGIIVLTFDAVLNKEISLKLRPNETLFYNVKAGFNLMGIYAELIGDNNAAIAAKTDSEVDSTKAGQPETVSDLKFNRRDLSVSYVSETVHSSEEIRKEWSEKGGRIRGRSILGNFYYLSMKDPGISLSGGGFGINYTDNFYKLKIPDYKTGLTKWTSLLYGISVSAAMISTFIEVDIPPSDPITFESSMSSIIFTGNLGFTLGLGKFKTEDRYKGIAFDFTYKPAVVINATEGEKSTTSMNFGGFGIDLHFTNFSAFANYIAPKAKSKFSFFFLPPIKDQPLFLTIGYGLVWYR